MIARSQPAALTRGQFAALRGWLQGLPPAANLAASRVALQIGHGSRPQVASARSFHVEVERLHDFVERLLRPDVGYDFAI